MCAMVRAVADSDECRFCGAPIVMAMTSKRRRVAVEPARDGGMILVPPEAKSGSSDPVIVVLDRERAAQPRTLTYRRHGEICPGRRRPRDDNRRGMG